MYFGSKWATLKIRILMLWIQIYYTVNYVVVFLSWIFFTASKKKFKKNRLILESEVQKMFNGPVFETQGDLFYKLKNSLHCFLPNFVTGKRHDKRKKMSRDHKKKKTCFCVLGALLGQKHQTSINVLYIWIHRLPSVQKMCS